MLSWPCCLLGWVCNTTVFWKNHFHMSIGVRFCFLNRSASVCHGFHCHGAVSRNLSVFSWLPKCSHTLCSETWFILWMWSCSYKVLLNSHHWKRKSSDIPQRDWIPLDLWALVCVLKWKPAFCHPKEKGLGRSTAISVPSWVLWCRWQWMFDAFLVVVL